MGKKAKEHRKKVAKRNESLKQQKERYMKIQKEMLMKMIDMEKQKGLFDNVPQIPQIGNDDIIIDGPQI